MISSQDPPPSRPLLLHGFKFKLFLHDEEDSLSFFDLIVCAPLNLQDGEDALWFNIISMFLNVFEPVLGVTVLLTLTVFSIMVNEMLPRVSDAVPIIG